MFRIAIHILLLSATQLITQFADEDGQLVIISIDHTGRRRRASVPWQFPSHERS